MRIPTQKQCFLLMCEMKMMDHIVVHSMQVCRVAVFLADRLRSKKIRLNHDLIQAAALLHDITKTRSFKTREDHARTGGEYLAELGYHEIGDLVRQHVRLDTYANSGTVSEAEVVNYADKRVLHDEIVVLDRRLDYILEKYARTPEHRERINLIWRKTRAMEKKLFKNFSFAPEDLSGLINIRNRAPDFSEYRMVCQKS